MAKITKILFLSSIVIVGIVILTFYLKAIVADEFLVVRQSEDKLKSSKAKSPGLYLIPTPKKIKRIPESILGGYSDFYYGNLGFRVPWTDFIRTLKGKSGMGLKFQTDRFISISSPTLLGMAGIVEKIKQNEDPIVTERSISMFGEENVRSTYDFMKLIFKTTPDQINILSTTEKVYTNMTLMAIKGPEEPVA